jgi:hypothetical protein
LVEPNTRAPSICTIKRGAVVPIGELSMGDYKVNVCSKSILNFVNWAYNEMEVIRTCSSPQMSTLK